MAISSNESFSCIGNNLLSDALDLHFSWEFRRMTSKKSVESFVGDYAAPLTDAAKSSLLAALVANQSGASFPLKIPLYFEAKNGEATPLEFNNKDGA